MNAEIEILPPEGQVPAFPTDEEKAKAIVAEIAKRARAHVPDISTAQGRAEIKSLAFQIARTKTAMDAAGKDMVADAKAQIAKVDGLRRLIRNDLDALKDEVRKPLTEWEEAKAKRDAEVEERLTNIRKMGEVAFDETSAEIEMRIDRLKDAKANCTPEEFDKRADEADKLCSDMLAAVRLMLEQAKMREETARERDALLARERERAQQEEAERKAREEAELKEREEREAKIRAERERQEAELKAAREAQAEAERQAREAQEREAAARREAEQAAERERQRIEEEARVAEARAKAEADVKAREEEAKKRRREASAEAMAAIMAQADIDEAHASRVLDAIQQRFIPHVKFEVQV